MTKKKVCRNSAELTTDNGEITFIAARSVKNLNGYTYDVASLQAQNADGDYQTISSEGTTVAIPLMVDHSSKTKEKIGNIDLATIENVDGVDQVVMHANFFKSEEAQAVRQRILDGELTDVSITTDWGDYSGEGDEVELNNAHVIEVSVVYAGAEPKAKILAKNSVEEPEVDEKDEKITALESENEELKNKLKTLEEEGNEEIMATQPTNVTGAKEATKEQVVNALTKLAASGAIRKMNRSQVMEAVKNAVTIEDGEGGAYVVPDAVFTEILAVTRPTDILNTFATIPGRKFTLMQEERSEADLARAGKWSKAELKAIQTSTLVPQKFATDFIFKMQEISYADMQESFGDLLLNYIRTELPQKLDEEIERAFIVGDGRAVQNARHITSIISLEAAAEDLTNAHVYNYDGSSDSSAVEAVMNGIAKIGEEGTKYAVMNLAELTKMRQVGLSTANGLPFSVDTVAGALGVERIFTREYVADGVVYVWTAGNVKMLTGGSMGETIEQYDIDYNNRKIEYIRSAGGAAAGIYSAVKVVLPESISA
jgi:HK97 family phage major capsid protein